ncbi:MAG: DUF2306 domain-containing protein [Candidatus Rokuibacteriota bacterium]
MAVLAAGIAAYAFGAVARGQEFFHGTVAAGFRDRPWAFWGHAAFAGVALLLGPLQLSARFRERQWRRHRILGRVYVVAGLIGAGCGLYLAPFAYGGAVTRLGFGLLAVATLGATATAYLRIRAGDVRGHRAWMTRSYALLFSAVTLRLELPLLILALGAFGPAYVAVSWLCWVPNWAAAEWIVRRRGSAI